MEDRGLFTTVVFCCIVDLQYQHFVKYIVYSVKSKFFPPQTSTSLKSFIDSWNIQTALWLKRCILFLLYMYVYWCICSFHFFCYLLPLLTVCSVMSHVFLCCASGCVTIVLRITACPSHLCCLPSGTEFTQDTILLSSQLYPSPLQLAL